MAPIFAQAGRLDGAIPTIHGLPAHRHVALAGLDPRPDERCRCHRATGSGAAFDFDFGMDKRLFLDPCFLASFADFGGDRNVRHGSSRFRRVWISYSTEPARLAAISPGLS